MKRPEQPTARAESDIAMGLLIGRALNGDASAYRAFLIEVAAKMRIFLAGLARRLPPEKIEDLVQEVLLAVHEKRDLYRPGLPVMPWVRAIAKHRLIDSIRADRRRPEFAAYGDEIERALASDQDVRRFESVDQLQALLECLDERQKQILNLAKIDGLPLEEIAERLGLSHSLVKVSIHRSLKKVRESIDG